MQPALLVAPHRNSPRIYGPETRWVLRKALFQLGVGQPVSGAKTPFRPYQLMGGRIEGELLESHLLLDQSRCWRHDVVCIAEEQPKVSIPICSQPLSAKRKIRITESAFPDEVGG